MLPKITIRKQDHVLLQASWADRMETQRSCASVQKLSFFSPIRQSVRLVPTERGLAGRVKVSSLIVLEDRCFCFMSLSRDPWKGRKFFSLHRTGIYCQIVHFDI